MPTFGDFETAAEPLAVINLLGHVATVWKARKAGGHDSREFVVKNYAPHRKSKAGTPEEALDRDRGLEFLEGVKQLKKAHSKGARHFAPVHDFGITAEGAWYVTDYYPRGSLLALIDRRAKVDSAALRQIVSCIVAGCLALKKSHGISHGNLKASNVFLAGKPRPLSKTPMVLADPYPAAPLQLARLDAEDRRTVDELLHQVMEVQDLRALGEIILQLVERRQVRTVYDYNYPIVRSSAWGSLGKDGERWRQICNQLLDPELSLAETNLVSLAKKFPARAAGGKALAVAAVFVALCLVGGGAYGFMRWNGIHQRQIQSQKRLKYEQFMAEGRTKFAARDYAGAKVDADSALENQPNDGDAIQLRKDALSRLDNLSAAQRKKDYDEAMKSGQAAYDRGDYNTAVTQAGAALAIRSADPAAAKLKKNAQVKIDELRDEEQRYRSAMQGGQAAYDRGDYNTAVTQAGAALAIRSADPAAAKLKKDAQVKIDELRDEEQRYRSAMQGGQAAYDRGDYNTAVTQAGAALAIRSADPAAAELKKDAQGKIGELLGKEQEYQTAMKSGQAAYDRGDYNTAVTQAGAALATRLADPAAAKLKKDAQAKIDELRDEEQRYRSAMQGGQAAYDRGDYNTAVTQAGAALAIRSADPAAAKLKKDAQAKIGEFLGKEQEYQAKIKAGRGAQEQRQWAEAVKEFGSAAKLARDLKDEAKGQVAQNELEYSQAMDEGESFLKNNKPADAKAKAEMALTKKVVDKSAGQNLISRADEKIDYKSAQSHLEQCQYAEALSECNKHESIPLFKELKAKISQEKNDFDNAQTKFEQGDYSFINDLRNFQDKSCFAAILSQAISEKNTYDNLKGMTNDLKNWNEVKDILNNPLYARFINKAGFGQFHAWLTQNDPITKLNAQLELFRVWFGVRDPDAKITDPYNNSKPAKKQPRGIDQDFYTALLKNLQTSYIKLEGPNSGHLQEINKIQSKIDYWNN